MLNNYEAIVKAVLDKTKFDSDMGELVRKQYTLSNIRIDTSNLVTEIQNALRSTSFDVHINPVFDNRNAQTVGQNLARGITSALNTGIQSSGVNLFENLLGNHSGVNQSTISRIISGITRDVGTANVQIRNMRTEFSNAANAANGLRNFRISGVDETGALLTNLTRINQRTGQVSSSITTVTQNFDTNTRAAQEVTDAYRELLSIQGRLNTLNASVLKLDTSKNSREISELNGQIETLTERYRQLRLLFNDDFSVEQLTNLDRAINMSADSLLLLQARIADTGNLNRITTEYKELYDTAKKISSLELKIAGLDSENDINQIRVLESQISDLEVTYGNLVASLNGRLPTEQWKKINDVFSDTVRKLDVIEAQTKDADKAVSGLQVVTFDNKMTTWLDNNSKASKRFGGAIEDLRRELKELYDSGNLTESGLKDLENRFKGVQQEAIAAGKVGKSFGSTFSNAFESIAKYVSVATVIDLAVDSLREMYTAVSDVDKSMINLRKVTDETEERYSSFLKSSAKSAQELGRTISGIVEQTAEWTKLGYSLDEAEELAKVSSMFANVAEIDDATAVADMVTAMKAYNIEASNAVTITDAINELSNRFATNAEGLGQGLTKSASAMSTAGTDLYKTLAMLTGGAEITQNAEEFGGFLRVSSMRIRGMRGELEELGEEVDSSVDSISKVQTQILNLTHGHVNIFDDNGEFREYYDIMEDIAEIYDSLKSTEQADLSEILFGKMRGNQGAALIQAFQSGQIQKAYQTAMDSEGSMLREQQAWTEGLEAAVNRLSAAWQGLSLAVLDSDFLKALVDSGTLLLNVLTKIVESGMAIPAIFAGITAIVKIKKPEFLKDFSFENLGKNINNVSKAFHGMKDAAGSGIGNVTSLGTAVGGLGGKLATLAKSAVTFLTTNPAGWAIMAAGAIAIAGTAFDALNETFDESIKKAEQSVEAYQEVESEIQELQTEFNNTQRRIDELAAMEANGSISLVEQDELDKLRTANELLDLQIASRERLKQSELENAAKDANNVLTRKDPVATGKTIELADGTFVSETESLDILERTQRIQKEIADTNDSIKSLYEEQEKYEADSDEFEKYEKMIESEKDKQEQLEASLANNLDIIFANLDTITQVKGYEDTIRQVRTLTDSIMEYGSEMSSAGSSTSGTIDTLEILSSAAEGTKKNCEKLVSEIGNIQSVLADQASGRSITPETFNSDELKDYTSALEYHNGVYQLNIDEVNELVKAKSDEQIAINNTNKSLAQSQYLKNAANIQRLRSELADLGDEESDLRTDIEKSIDSLLSQNETILDQCDGFDLMTASLREATSAYQHWINAQSASQTGDMFDESVKAIQHINDTLNNKKSEFYGRVGRSDYTTAIDFIVPESVDHDDQESVKNYLDKIHALFTYDDDGNYAGLNIDTFCKNAVDAGLMVLNEAGTEYEIVGGKIMEDFANGMNLSMPMVQAMFGEMEEFGGKFDWSDETIKTMSDLAVSAEVAAESLRKANDDFSIDLDIGKFDAAEEQISALDKNISKMQEFKIGADATDIEYANSIIEYCVAKKQELEKPAILSVDSSKLSEGAAEAVTLLQEFKTTYNELELNESLDIDTTEAQTKVDELAAQISSSKNAYLISLALDSTSVEALNTSITELEMPRIFATFDIDNTSLVDYLEDEKQTTVRVNVDDKEFRRWEKEIQNEYHTTLYVHTKETKSSSTNSGSSGGRSNKNTYNTAMAGGSNYRRVTGGKVLVGELGRELVVDVHSGKWYTVGDNGAEFCNIPAGAIVFNHEQTESLLKKGYVFGRASALVNGTAMVTGGISVGGAQSSTPSGGNSTSNYKKPSSKASNSTNSGLDDTLESLDWIEIAIDRISRAVENLKSIATSAYKALKTKLGATYDEISMVNQEISIQQKAYERYMSEASKVGLSSDLAKLVREGEIDIDKYGENTRELISEYQQWYEKALECDDAIVQLHDDLAALYEDNFNAIKDDFDNQLELLEHLTNTYDTAISAVEAQGYLESTKYYAALQDVERKNIEVLQAELAALAKSMSEAMNSGEIEKGSEAWYSFQQEINSVKEAIDEANLSMLEYAQTMREVEWGHFDYIQERISQITNESEFLIDLLSGSDLFDDKGNMTANGTATAGLHGMNYNTYMNQADQYAQEILSLDEQIANDPNNTQLIERREELLKLQQESILAAEAEKQALISLVEEGINIEIESMRELADSYIEALESAEDLYNYRKKIGSQTETIASIEKQLSAYSGFDDEETAAKVQKLKVELESARDELEQTEYERYVSDQRKLVDDLMTEYETALNSRMDNIDVLIEEMISYINENATLIADTLASESENVGYVMSDSMQEVWSGAFESLDGIISVYGDDFTLKLTSINSVLERIQANTAAMVGESDDSAQDTIGGTSTTTNPTPGVTAPVSTPTPTPPSNSSGSNKTITVGGKINAGNAKIYEFAGDTSGEKQFYSDDPVYTVLEEKNSYIKVRHHRLSSGVSGWFKKSDVKAYRTGGLVDYTGLAWVDGQKSKPESFLDAEDTANLIELISTLNELKHQNLTIGNLAAYNAIPRIGGIDVSKLISSIGGAGNAGNTFGDINFDIHIDHVEDYDDFVGKMQSDPKFERMIHDMTVNRLVGGSQLSKYRNRFGK